MPRIRSIKPDFWNDEKIGQEPESTMLTFIGLWNFSDDYGVVRSNSIWLKSQIFPYKSSLRIEVFSAWLNRLVELDALIPFTHRGEGFYYIRTFREHQKVDKPSKARHCKEKDLVNILAALGYYFGPEGECTKTLPEYSPNTPRTLPEYSGTEGEKEEYIGKGEEKETVSEISETPPPVKTENSAPQTGGASDTVPVKYLVPAMMDVWMGIMTDYPRDKEKDSPALQSLAKFIANIKQEPYDPVNGQCVEVVLTDWEKVTEFVSSDDFYKSYSLHQVEKHIQNIIQRMKHGRKKRIESPKPGTIAIPDGERSYGSL